MRVLLRALCVLCTLTWWVLPGMGIIDLSVTWDPEWQVMLEAGWGVLFTVGLGLPFLAVAIRPALSGAALLQLGVVAGCLLVGLLAGLEPEGWWILAMLVVEVPLLFLLRVEPLGRSARPEPILLALGVLATPPALIYAWDMARLNRLSADWLADITNGVDHFSVQAAVAVALFSLPVAAACWPPARRLLGTSTALMAGYLGLVSLSWPGADAGFGSVWSVATMIWSAGVLAAAWWPTRGAADPHLSPAEVMMEL